MKPVNLFFSGLMCSLSCTSSFASNAAASSVAVAAAATVAPSTPPGNLVQIVISLLVVVGLLIALSMAFKKFGLDRLHSNFPVKIIGAISIGSNQRIMVIEAGDEWVVLGVTPQAISPLTSMARQHNHPNAGPSSDPGAPKAPFSTWMQSTLEKYRDKKP